MEKNLVRGNKGLAEKLGVHYNTVLVWRKAGVLTDATVSDYGRVIIYDLDKALECLNYHQMKQGRRSAV